MKAAFIEEQGGPEVLKYGDVPDPVARSNEVVVDIYAASVNGADWKVRSGTSGSITEFPYILGRDFSGLVSAVGEEVEDLGVGVAQGFEGLAEQRDTGFVDRVQVGRHPAWHDIDAGTDHVGLESGLELLDGFVLVAVERGDGGPYFSA